MSRNVKFVQGLKDAKLRRIRYELRTLLYLEKEKRIDELHDSFALLHKDGSIDFKKKKKEYRIIIEEQEILRLNYGRYPLCCGICGDRMANLIYNPIMHQWRCGPCYQQAHEKFPEKYP